MNTEETQQPAAGAATSTEAPTETPTEKVEKPARRWYRVLLKANPATGSRRKLVIHGAGVLKFRRGQKDPRAEDCEEQTIALFPEQALRIAANPDFSVLPGSAPAGSIRRRTAHEVTPAEPVSSEPPADQSVEAPPADGSAGEGAQGSEGVKTRSRRT